MKQCRVAIVGAGPAGLAAACVTAEAGLRPTVIDDNPLPGGQIYRQPPEALRSSEMHLQGSAAKRGADLLERFHRLQDRIDYRPGTSVWGCFPPRRLALRDAGGASFLDADHLILAPGAYEFVPPFPGWTLPGVMTPGAAQLLVKAMRVLPGKRAVVAGTGPFLLVVADYLHEAGVKIEAVVEMARTIDSFRALPGLLSQPDLLREGLGYLYRLRRAGVKIFRGHVVVEAVGGEAVREVVVAPCDAEGYPDRSRAWTVPVDTLCVGFGFVPRTQLAQLAGCRLQFSAKKSGWVPEVDDSFQTSVPGVWVVGDGGGIGGARAAQLQGTLAGLAVARQLGALDKATFDAERKPLLRRLARLNRFRDALARLARLRPGVLALAAKDTLVCRCEEVSLGEVEDGMASGGTDLRTLKVMTRLGMGPCQGQMCWPAVARLVAARTGRSLEAVGPLSVRPPLTPTRLGDLVDMGL